jgi:RNA polymerase sigma factor (sigma-70 family)
VPVAITEYAEAKDQQLLALYQRERDQHAFTVLVERYHSLVLGVARRMLGCSHAAEDVLQATFLVLARDATRIRKRGSLASWLYGVAFRIAARVVKQRARRSTSALKDDVMVSDDPLEKLSEQFEHNAALEELHQLPDKIRTAMVLRYLQGKSNSEVAADLHVSEAAVEGRLKRGRSQLRMRLARQGVTFAAAIAVLEATKDCFAADASQRVSRTVEACFGPGTGAEGLGSDVVHLAEEEILKMAAAKVTKGMLVACLTLGVVAVGWSLSGNRDALGQRSDPFAEVAAPGGGLTSQPTYGNDAANETRVTIPIATRGDNATQDGGLASLAGAGHYSVESYTPSEIKIIKALSESTRLEFDDTPLQQVVEFLQDYHDIQILFDQQALEEEAIDITSEGVTVDLSDIQLRSGLNHILERLNLTFIVKDELLFITSQGRAEDLLAPRVYRTDDAWNISNDELVEIITRSVAPDSWHEVGGMGSITTIEGGLVIAQSYRVHNEINKLLGQLNRVYRTPR